MVWQGIRLALNNKTKSMDPPQVILHNNKNINDPVEVSNAFNNYFGCIAEKTKSKIIPTNESYTNFLLNSNNNSFFLSPTLPEEVNKLILSLNHTKADGPGSIPTKLLKLISPTISELFSQITNECFVDGIFPDCMKDAYIVPIHKKESKLEPGNYRPISLLSNLSKIFEKLLHSRLYSFLEKHQCLYQNQFGFRQGHSTKYALISLTENIRKALDKGQFAAGIFIDLQKAFDTVEHSILLRKLDHYGIRGVANNLFKSYLSNRHHTAIINNVCSDKILIKHGVPQGSVLGPLLFLIYINDLHFAIKHSQTLHFADDTSLLCCNNSLKQLNQNVNEDLKLLCIWLRTNKISLNTKKTELIILFRSKQKKINKHLNFRLSGQKLTPSKQVQYLGVTLDEHLS